MNPLGTGASGSSVAWFATKGSGSNEAARIEHLLAALPNVRELSFDRQRKKESFRKLVRAFRELRPRLVVMEGTGLAGGLACLIGRLRWGVPYVVSSGDAVGPFMRSHRGLAGWLFEAYERVLCRCSAGFIGWTPYLCGRALTFGAPRAVTAAGWGAGAAVASRRRELGAEMRRRWGVPGEALVVGLVGSLEWNRRHGFCYGWDLVTAARTIDRPDLAVVVVGGGSGLERLRTLAGDRLGRTIFLPGPVDATEVPAAMAAMDVGSLPQSLDGVGLFRYTTKLSEYLDAGLPVITNRIPMAYDLDTGWLWRLPGAAPWSATHVQALRELLQGMDRRAIEERRACIVGRLPEFDATLQQKRVTAFIADLLDPRG